MAMTFHCDIVSAEGEIFSGQIESVIAHGELGDLVPVGQTDSPCVF